MKTFKNEYNKMKLLKIGSFVLFSILFFTFYDAMAQTNETFNSEEMMIRIAEIEIDSTYLDEYIAILKEESEASVRLESGVISIYPMYQKDNPTEIRLLEIYANKEAYESHLKTPHFQDYKTSTLKMVKSLKLIEMEAIDAETMPKIFSKIKH